jgi:hypothetical protein
VGGRIKRVELQRNTFDPVMPATPLDWARRQQTDTVERNLDAAILEAVACDHSPKIRPEVRGAADTLGTGRYGGNDGNGHHSLVVGRSAESQNRRER